MTKARSRVCVRNYGAVSLAGGQYFFEDREDERITDGQTRRIDRQTDSRMKEERKRARESNKERE